MIDFLILGAEKSGTTWLADMLRQHPDIFIPEQKELFYFNKQFFESPELDNYNYSLPLSWYLAHFDPAQLGQVRGEASPAYLWDPQAAAAIHDFGPNLKLIAVLRNPVDRAYSQYRYYLQRGTLAEQSFRAALKARPDMISRGRYAEQLERYLTQFSTEQIYVALFDDLRSDNRAFLNGVQSFLGLDAHLPADLDAPTNVTGAPRWAGLNRALAALRYPLRKYNPGWLLAFLRWSGLASLQERVRLANTRPARRLPELDGETRSWLGAKFKSDTERLEGMINRDLSHWKNNP